MDIVSIRKATDRAGVPRVSPAQRLLLNILENVGLQEADSRPLYLYRIDEEQYARGRSIIGNYAACIDPANGPLCAVLAVVTAEWFRREAKSLFLKWSEVGVIPDGMSPVERGEVVAAGLRWWGLKPRISRHDRGKAREFLLTLALNGGLPSALIVGETATHVRRYFEGMMSYALEADGTLTTAQLMAQAEARAEILPKSYQDETVFELTAELTAELIALRAEIPREQLQANPAAWLDARVPGWRDRLPIHLPEAPAACNRLFNALLSIQPRAKGGGIGVRRLLVRSPAGDWIEGFEVLADGTLDFQALAEEDEGRFRAYFIGAAERLMSREFSQIYRSATGNDGTFSVTARATGRPGVIAPVSFADPIGVRLVRDGHGLPPTCWPQGQARVANCYILKPTEKQAVLELAGTGSVRSSASVLYAWVAQNASVLIHDQGTAECWWQGERHALWKIEGMAVVTTAERERYRIQTGSDVTDDRHLEIDPVYLPDIQFESRDFVLVAR